MASDILTSTFLRIRGRLLASARRLLADDDAADDALQDAFYRLWQHRHNIATTAQAEGLSVVAVRNTCLDTLRRSSARPTDSIELLSADIPDNSTDDPADRDDLYNSVKAIIDSSLSPREKAVIAMRDTEGMDFADIAEELGISEANTRMILSRARRTVRDIYLSSQKRQTI